MEMTIDNSIETLTSILAEATANEDAVCYVTVVDAPALKKAINTMRKYQKIERIINCSLDIQEDVLRYKAICEVVEDGND